MIEDFDYDASDPLNRLEFIEVCLEGHALAIERISEQLKDQAKIIEQFSVHFLELAQGLNSQHRLIMDMGRHIRDLEDKK
jgi:hypothetical protein